MRSTSSVLSPFEVGQPFVPYKMFLVHCVPEPLSRSRLVSAGAKLCYAALARRAGKDGHCFPWERTIAAELGVSERQVRRYIRELEQAKLIQSIQRGLQKANSYLFLWHQVFESANVLIRQDRTSMSDQDRTHVSDQDRTHASTPVKEEETPIRDTFKETEDRSIWRPKLKTSEQRLKHRDATTVPPDNWPKEDVDVITRHLKGFRYSDGRFVEPSATLVSRLLSAAEFYKITSFELAAFLERKRRDVERNPRWWPEKDDWFVAVVDRFYSGADINRIPPPPTQAPAPTPPVSSPSPAQELHGDPDPDLVSSIAALAKMKKLGERR